MIENGILGHKWGNLGGKRAILGFCDVLMELRWELMVENGIWGHRMGKFGVKRAIFDTDGSEVGTDGGKWDFGS